MGVRRFASHGVYGTKAGKSKQGWFHGGLKVESLSVMGLYGTKAGKSKDWCSDRLQKNTMFVCNRLVHTVVCAAHRAAICCQAIIAANLIQSNLVTTYPVYNVFTHTTYKFQSPEFP